MAGIEDFPLLRVLNRDQVAELQSSEREQPDQEEMFSDLSKFLLDKWSEFQKARETTGIEDTMISNLYAVKSQYEPAKLDALKASGMSTVFFGLTGLKCRAALAWLLDIYSNQIDKLWGLRASPSPDIPDMLQMYAVRAAQTEMQAFMERFQSQDPSQSAPQPSEADIAELQSKMMDAGMRAIRDEAGRRTERSERKMRDLFLTGGFDIAFRDFIWDVITMPVGVLKSPVVRMKKSLLWLPGTPGQVFSLGSQLAPVPCFDRVSPFDCYPAPLAVTFEDDFIQRMRLNRTQVSALLDMPGYDSDVIRELLSDFDILSGSDVLALDATREELETKEPGANTDPNTIEGLEFYVSTPGKLLINEGFMADTNGNEIDSAKSYDMVVLMLNRRLVNIVMNPDPLGRKPFSKTSWVTNTGSFWGQGIPEILDGTQQVANASVRSLVNNMGLASGFQVILNDVSRVANGENITTIFPHKIWQFTNSRNSNAPPLDFKQPASNAEVLLKVLEWFMQMASNITGVPEYYVSDMVSGVGRTASGLSMLMSSAAKGLKRVLMDIDDQALKSTIERVYSWMMQNTEDPEIQGDVEVVVMGAMSTMAKELMAERRTMLLRETNNPVDVKLMGLQARAMLLKEALRSVEINGEPIMPPLDEVKREIEASEAAEQMQVQAAMQAEQAKLQVAQMDAQLKQMDMQIKAQKAQMDAQLGAEKMKTQQTDAIKKAAIAEKMQSQADLKALERMDEYEQNQAERLREAESGVPSESGASTQP